jgi:hypothetical protein
MEPQDAEALTRQLAATRANQDTIHAAMRTSLAQRAIMNATMHACLLRVERTLGRIDTTLGRIDMTVDTVDTTLATIGRLLEGRRR